MAVGLGTATAAYLDLVAYLLRMNVHFEALKRGRHLQLLGHERFEWFLSPTFKFILLVSVKLQDEVIGYELCQRLSQFNREHQLHNFEYRLRISTTTPKRWDAEFFKSVFEPKDVTRVFIASRAGSEEALTKLFLDVGVSRGAILIA